MYGQNKSVNTIADEMQRSLMSTEADEYTQASNLSEAFQCLSKAADILDDIGMYKSSALVTDCLEKFAKRPTTDFIFPPDHPKVKDNKGHFPIPDIEHARSALRYAGHYDKAPDWYDGPLKELLNTIADKVEKEYKSIEVSEKSRNPGKG